MAEKTITITAVYAKETGWTDIVDENKDRYSTKDHGYRELAQGNKGSRARVVYEEQQNGKYTNRYIKDLEVTQAVATGGDTPTGSQDPYRRSKEEMRRSEALQAASRQLPGWVDIEKASPVEIAALLARLADAIVPYLENGSDAQVYLEAAESDGIPF